MTLQLRTYTLQPGAMDAWKTIWRDQIRPLREKLGFTVPAVWEVSQNNQFIWLMQYDGPDDWPTRDAAFHDSPERLAMIPNPADLIVSIETCFLVPVD
jgi:hypothetical protein